MSRTIDQAKIDSGDLTEDEILYLAQRDRLPESVRADYEAQEEIRRRLNNISPMLADVPNTGTVNTLSVTLDDLKKLGIEVQDDGLNPPEQFQGARLGQTATETSEPSEDGEDDEYPPYTDKWWTNERLRTEIAARNEDRDEGSKLSMEGNKEQLIATLEADDEE